MTAQEIRVEIERITAAVKRHEWTPEVFERTEAILYYQGGDIFNTLRRELLPEEYEAFDRAFCNHFRPDLTELADWIGRKRKEEAWKQKKAEILKQKQRSLRTARENLVRKTAGTCDTIRIQLESLENTVNSLDQTLNVADPELMPCVGLLANSPEALPLELIGSVAEKFKGNRLALLALAAVAKENNKSFLEGKAVDGSGAVKQIRNKFDMLADGYPKTLHLLPEVKNDLVKLCEAYGHEIGDVADTYLGADYGEIVNLIMREAAGL